MFRGLLTDLVAAGLLTDLFTVASGRCCLFAAATGGCSRNASLSRGEGSLSLELRGGREGNTTPSLVSVGAREGNPWRML